MMRQALRWRSFLCRGKLRQARRGRAAGYAGNVMCAATHVLSVVK